MKSSNVLMVVAASAVNAVPYLDPIVGEGANALLSKASGASSQSTQTHQETLLRRWGSNKRSKLSVAMPGPGGGRGRGRGGNSMQDWFTMMIAKEVMENVWEGIKDGGKQSNNNKGKSNNGWDWNQPTSAASGPGYSWSPNSPNQQSSGAWPEPRPQPPSSRPPAPPAQPAQPAPQPPQPGQPWGRGSPALQGVPAPKYAQCAGNAANGACGANTICIGDPRSRGMTLDSICVPTLTTCGGPTNAMCNNGLICVPDPRQDCKPWAGDFGCNGLCV